MALTNLAKFHLFALLVMATNELTDSAETYLDNAVSTNEASQPSLYTQAFYIPYQKYLPSHQKYTPSRPESQVPAALGSTEKTLLSPTYKLTVDTSKYVTSQVTKPALGTQANYPYLYTIAKVAPSTASSYTSASSSGSEYDTYNNEEPKKYHFGYRVTNPHTGTEFGHSEVNDGHTAKGYYHVLLPDGRLQNVKYWAGPSGYHATITYETQY